MNESPMLSQYDPDLEYFRAVVQISRSLIEMSRREAAQTAVTVAAARQAIKESRRILDDIEPRIGRSSFICGLWLVDRKVRLDGGSDTIGNYFDG
jgi:hypothetical protein